jgi:hypothetical protein
MMERYLGPPRIRSIGREQTINGTTSKKRKRTAPTESSPGEAMVSVLPMEVRVGDRLTDEQREWEVDNPRPYTAVA